MNVTPTQIEGVTSTLTNDEARLVLVDATDFQTILRPALGEEQRKRATPRPWTNGKTAKAAQSNGANPTKRGQKPAALRCKFCGKAFKTQGRYNNHLRDNHQNMVAGVHAADEASAA